MRCHADDAKDDGGNVLEYCDQLSRYSLVLLRTPCTQLRLRELCQFILGCADVTPLGVFNNTLKNHDSDEDVNIIL